MERRIAVRGLIMNDSKLLCVKLNDNSILAEDTYCVPGGGLDPNEDLKSGVKRELKEELGVDAVVGRLLFIQQYLRKDGVEDMEFFFHIINSKDFVDINLSDTTHGDLEISQTEFVNPLTSKILPKFITEVNIEQAIKQNFPVQIFNYL
ncbi:MAG: NUDIX domain-containing protein [bacterium]|nr:NUDIX domain-containing protein [bacterium]